MSTIINLGTTPQQAVVADCSVINILFDQRRKLKYFNIPPPRYTPTSPYPDFTPQQLDMRRKAEILKYNRQNSKGNNLSKKQAYSILAKNGSSASNPFSQFTIDQLQNNTATQPSTCNADVTKPTWTTACGVPGPPMLLQYDPTVPLYNYINDATQDTNYSSLPDTNYTMMYLYTQNELEYIYEAMDNIVPDACSNNVVIAKNYQTRTLPLGNIVNTKYMPNQFVSYSFNIPIGIWMIGFKDQGIIYTECDGSGEYFHYDPSYGNLEYKNECYIKFPGNFTDTTSQAGTTLTPGINFHIDYSINRPSISIGYSGIPVNILSTPNFYSTLNTTTPIFFDASFIPYNAAHQFYGIQYVGNLIIDNVILAVQPEEVYDVSLTMSYYYDFPMFQQMDAFQTGLFFNLTQANVNVADGCNYETQPPPYIDMSYSMTPITNFPTMFQNFDAGSTVLATAPAIATSVFTAVGANSVTISHINGVYTSFYVTRIQCDSSWSPIATTESIPQLGTNQYTDATLIPNTNYEFKLTPVYNHMSGSTNFVGGIGDQNYGRVTTKLVYVNATLGTVTTSTVDFTGITGTFSYYNVERFQTTSGQTVVKTGLTSPTYSDVNLDPGKTYRYRFTPVLTYPSGIPPYEGAYYEKFVTLYTCNITSASIGPATSTSVTIINIDGTFDVYSIIRDGVTSKVYLYLPKPAITPFTFVDNDTRLVSGAVYTYTIIPSIRTPDGTLLDGSKKVIGKILIP
jgi:hypothetical protein